MRPNFAKISTTNSQEIVNKLLEEGLNRIERKIIVLDDDPTGVQSVHGVSVFTQWDIESFLEGFKEEDRIFFILTNSRSFSTETTVQEHKKIAENIVRAAKITDTRFIIISRSDSTLRGHYPIETETLKNEVEKLSNLHFDGEIICPFFEEGGRFTIGDIHYVKESDVLTPVAQTEFAKDKTFGYKSSHLGKWIEEKTYGKYKKEDCIYISSKDLQECNIEGIQQQLNCAKNFDKIIVNAERYIDLKVFAVALISVIAQGKEFIIRSAASLTKVLGNICDRQLLSVSELIDGKRMNGGLVVIGSHVKKTTMQLDCLKQSKANIEYLEFNQHLVFESSSLEKEIIRITAAAQQAILQGVTAVIYTRRERLDLDTHSKEKQLALSLKISSALVDAIKNLSVTPKFIVAKGGITSSDIGTKALNVKKAVVMGQIKQGIPVWRIGVESRFPGIPYIIFPGNVGEETTLREVVEALISFDVRKR